MKQTIVEMFYVVRDPAWAPWAVQYFFLIGLSVGAFLLSLPGLALGKPEWRETSRMALLAALVCGLAAPVALLSDLHNPGRFLNFYLHPQPHSWMSWGAFFIPAYVGLLLVYAWAALAPEFRAAAKQDGVLAPVQKLLGGPARPGALAMLGIATLIAAALVALYTGVEVMVIKARPLWNSVLLPFQFLTTAVAGAIGLMLLLERFIGAGDRDVEARLNRLLAADRTPVLVNLASQEYFKSVDRSVLKGRVIECVFEEGQDGHFKVVSFFAKRARGLMARFATQHRISTPRQLGAFDLEGYAHAPAASAPDRLVFRRSVA